jgi:hypothetical protein
VLASGFESDSDALRIRADARVLGATLRAGQGISYLLNEGRMAYLVPARGDITVNGVKVHAREGAAIRQDRLVAIVSEDDSEILLIDTA